MRQQRKQTAEAVAPAETATAAAAVTTTSEQDKKQQQQHLPHPAVWIEVLDSYYLEEQDLLRTARTSSPLRLLIGWWSRYSGETENEKEAAAEAASSKSTTAAAAVTTTSEQPASSSTQTGPSRIYRPLPEVPFDGRLWYFIYTTEHLDWRTANYLSRTSRGLKHLAELWLDLEKLRNNAWARRHSWNSVGGTPLPAGTNKSGGRR